MCSPVRASQIAHALKLPRVSVVRRLEELIKHGYVERVGNAPWSSRKEANPLPLLGIGRLLSQGKKYPVSLPTKLVGGGAAVFLQIGFAFPSGTPRRIGKYVARQCLKLVADRSRTRALPRCRATAGPLTMGATTYLFAGGCGLNRKQKPPQQTWATA
jgi:hypothetical protein